MEQLRAMTGRNLRVYFRDKGSIFFSLLSMMVVIGLMVFFLGDMNINAITNLLSAFPGRDALEDAEHARQMVLMWTCAGILSINGVTITLAAYSVMIKDRVSGKNNSFETAPVSRVVLALSYILSAWVASVIICLLTLFLTETYCVMQGMSWFSIGTHGKLLFMIMVNSFTYAALMYVMAGIAKTEGAWSGIGTVVGTLVGFLGGIYVPVGTLSDSIVNILKLTPVLYGTAMFREVMTKDITELTFSGVPGEVLSEYRETMGITLETFGKNVTFQMEWMILLICGILFLGIGVGMLTYGKKTDR